MIRSNLIGALVAGILGGVVSGHAVLVTRKVRAINSTGITFHDDSDAARWQMEDGGAYLDGVGTVILESDDTEFLRGTATAVTFPATHTVTVGGIATLSGTTVSIDPGAGTVDLTVTANDVLAENFHVGNTTTGLALTNLEAKAFSIDYDAPPAGDCSTQVNSTWTGATTAMGCLALTPGGMGNLHYVKCNVTAADTVASRVCVNDGATAGTDFAASTITFLLVGGG